MKRTIRKGRLGILLGGIALFGAGTVGAHELQYRRQAYLLTTQADELAVKGDKVGAIQLYQQYLNFRPKDGDAMAKYASLLESIATDRPRDQVMLIEVFEQLIAINDIPRLDVRKKLVDLCMKYGYVTNAKLHLRALEEAKENTYRNDPKLWEDYATCELIENVSLKNFEKAAEYLRKAIKCSEPTPANPETFHELAKILRYEIKTKAAQKEADQVIEDMVSLRPNDVKARLTRSRYLMGIGQVDKAKKDVEFVRRNGGSGDADIMLAIASSYVQEGQLGSAQTILKKGVEEFPKDVRMKLSLTEVLLKLNETKLATDQLKESVKSLSPTTPIYFMAVDKLFDLNEVDVVNEAMKTWEKDEQTKAQSDFLKARIALKQSDWPTALVLARNCVNQVSRVKGFEGRGELLLAQANAASGNYEEALNNANKAKKADPGNILAKIIAAEAHERLGQFSLAVEAYKDAKAYYPAAKVNYIKSLMAEQLVKPVKERSWTDLENELKGEQATTELEIIRIQLLLAKGKSEEAIQATEQALIKEPKKPALYIALSELRTNIKNPSAGLQALDEAESHCGDRPEFRIHRARLFALDPATAEGNQISALADRIDKFTPIEQNQVLMSIGQTLLSLRKNKDAEPLFRRYADNNSNDILSRLFLFDIATERNDYDKANLIAEEFIKIEGADGPTYVVCKAIAALPKLNAKTALETIEWRKKVEAVKSKKDGWGRMYACLGDLNDLLGNEDATIENYIKAIERGDRNPNLLKKTYRLLTGRKQYEQANMVLARANNIAETARGGSWNLATKDPKTALNSIDANSRQPSDQILRGQLLLLNGKPKEAEAAYRKALNLCEGKLPEAWVPLIRFLVSVNRKSDAIAALEEAKTSLAPLAMTDRKGSVSLSLGQCYEAVGDYQNAERSLMDCIKELSEQSIAITELVGLYQRTNRQADAEKLLDQAIRNPTNENQKRLYRRHLAICKISRPDSYPYITQAISLIDQNIVEANQIEDIRAKALILAIDPLRMAEAKNLLKETTKRFPLTAIEHSLLAQIYIIERDLSSAETELIEATKMANVRPEHLAALSKVQIQQDKLSAASDTIERLKLVAPSSWYAISEEARYLAKNEKQKEAKAKLFELPLSKDINVVSNTIAPFFEEIGMLQDAEEQYRKVMEESPQDPKKHVPLAGFYLRNKEPLKAFELAKQFATQPNVPEALSARIMSGSIRSKGYIDISAVWANAKDYTRKFIADNVAKNPKNADLRYAQAELADAEGKYSEAIAAYEAALALSPNNPVFENNLAFLLASHAKDKSDRPLTFINDVIKQRGPDATRLDTRAIVHLAAGRHNEAIQDLSMATQLSSNPVYRFHLALAYEISGNTSRRDTMHRIAMSDNLSKEMLHPTEWDQFDRLNEPKKKPAAKPEEKETAKPKEPVKTK